MTLQVPFYDWVLDVAHQSHRTPEVVLKMPARRFFYELGRIHKQRDELSKAAEKNPLAALALMIGSMG